MTTPSYHAYVAYHSGRAIDLFAGFDDGALEYVEQYALSGMGLPLAVNPDGTRLYASTFNKLDEGEIDRIDSFSRNPSTGELQNLGSTRTVGRLTHISVDKSGRFVLGASYFSDLVVSHKIQPDGSLDEAEFSFPTGRNAHHIQTDPSNKYAFVPNLGSSQVLQLKFDAETGEFSYNDPPAVEQPAGAGCRHIAQHPNGTLMFLVNERDGSVVSFAFDAAQGTLCELHRTSVLRDPIPQAWAAQIHVSPDGEYLFASERNTHVLTRWRIDPVTGAFSEKTTIDVARNPRCFDIDPSGRYLVLTGLEDNLIEVFYISIKNREPKRLSKITSHREPSWVEILPAQNPNGDI